MKRIVPFEPNIHRISLKKIQKEICLANMACSRRPKWCPSPTRSWARRCFPVGTSSGSRSVPGECLKIKENGSISETIYCQYRNLNTISRSWRGRLWNFINFGISFKLALKDKRLWKVDDDSMRSGEISKIEN